MALDANGNVVITKVPSISIPKLPADWNPAPGYGGIVIRPAGAAPSGITLNGNSTPTNYTAPDGRDVHLPGYNPPLSPADVDVDFGGLPSNSDGGSSSSSAHPMSAEFIKDTYDPELGYERYDSPGDNPYISNYTPPQFGYMNDPSTLSPEELAYREGNIKGLDDRQNSVENAGALLNNYIFSIKEELNKTPKTKIGIIGKDQEVDNYQDRIFTSREGYESERDKEGPYDKYDSSKYY